MNKKFSIWRSNIFRVLSGPFKWLAVFSVATNILLLAMPIHMLQVYDRVLTSGSMETLIFLTLIVVAAIVVYGICEAIRGVLAQRLSARFASEVADDLFDKLVTSKDPQLNKTQLLRDFNQVRSFLGTRQAIGVFDLPFAPLFLMLMFFLHVYLGALALVGIVLLVLIAFVNKSMTDEKRSHSNEKTGEATNFAHAVLQRSEDISAMGLIPNIMERWGEKTVEALNTADEASTKSSAFYGLSKFLRQTLQVMTMALGAYLVLDGQISGGMIFAASMISSRALMPIEQIIGAWSSFSQSREAYERIENLLKDESDAAEKPTSLPAPHGVINVEDLSYSVSPDPNAKPILSGVSFTAKPGSVLAIIGPSGSGKSTLARLMVSAIKPSSGAIRLDGFELENWDDATRGRIIGYVPQDISLFPGTIAENIARMEVNPNDRKIIEAAHIADVHELVSTLPDGYQTKIGGGDGIRLSGGQRQRIALARAFYTSPKVLVLDEPNAHLDSQGEEKLQQTLLRAKQHGVTVITVTQRQSLLKIADNVLRIENGQAKMATAGSQSNKGMENLKQILQNPQQQGGLANGQRAKPANNMAGKFADLNKKLSQSSPKSGTQPSTSPSGGAV